MATRYLTRSLLTAFTRSYTSIAPPSSLSSFSLLRLRPLIAVAANLKNASPPPTPFAVRGFATRQTSSSLNDPNPNWSNRPPKETILLDGCDFEHWLVVMEKPEGDPTRDEIIDSYIKTLATIVGSEEEARMKIYSVSTRHYYAFGALVSEELSYKLKELPRVRWVLPDSYLDVRNKDYGGEPFINGQAVPYDPKYHEEWVRNNARANERNRRNDRPRNFDRSRNFERRRDMQTNQNSQNPGSNMPPGGPPNMRNPPPPNMGGMQQPNMGGMHQPGMGGPPNMGGMQQQGMGGPPNMGGMHQQGMGGPPNPGGMHQQGMGGPPNPGGMHQQGMGGPPNPGGMHQPGMGRPPNVGGMQQPNMPPPNMGGGPTHNYGGVPNSAPNFQYNSGSNSGGTPYPTGPGPNQSYSPNPSDGNPYQNQNMPGRDMPPPNYR
ncbi:PREDICTED: multiple organellar RNA editing factor 8, chloroplastic/mitochondrial-like [Nicotiana attenuata]|uniref:Multiple organellar rna editing factor 8, chloroplasticmitochondrial n=1 Tax=Nicotiana attenuata TaxID=49451 RepID=A0A1J6J3B6_NICAT|nr:PREDICTED: multiple organellar RNA editing factor 8, chloroplastic/mitochondrial-like [Nicotiana attenuata]OIT01801.1 multiple organellar rna editing factor 8, chloroplasticmitochondrial [Nicotiana attenuata]